MNYFAHGYQFIESPYFLAGTAVPDWLSVADRKVRARSKGAQALLNDADPHVAALASGIVQHHHDDDWFHRTRAFAELSWRFTAEIRDALPKDDGLRPSFLGHILVELLLDAALSESQPGLLEQYYSAMEEVDAGLVQATVNRIAARSTDRLGEFVELFRRHRFLFDYTDDDKLLFRLNQIMQRVKLPPLPDSMKAVIAPARNEVWRRREELLAAPGRVSND